MRKKRKTVRASDFKKWLRNRPDEQFGCGTEECPLHEWLGIEMDFDTLDKLPPWCSRFVGRWDALSNEGNPGYDNTGWFALSVLDNVV